MMEGMLPMVMQDSVKTDKQQMTKAPKITCFRVFALFESWEHSRERAGLLQKPTLGIRLQSCPPAFLKQCDIILFPCSQS